MKKYKDIILRLIFCLSALLITEIRTTKAAESTVLVPGQIHIEFQSDGLVSLYAFKAQRINILNELAKYMDIELFASQLDDQISLNINQQPLDSVFIKLLGEQNFLLRYEPRLVGEDQQSSFRFYRSKSTSIKKDPSRSYLSKQVISLKSGTDNHTQIIEKIEDFGDFENPGSIQQLEKLLNSESVIQRLTVAESLGDIGSAEAVNLLKKLISDPSPNVQEAAIYALSDIGSPDAVQVLGLAINNEIPDIRELAISELALINNNQSVESLMKFFNQQDTGLQIRLLRAIAGINTPTAKEHLWEKLKSENPQISITAYELLNQTAQN